MVATGTGARSGSGCRAALVAADFPWWGQKVLSEAGDAALG